MSHLLFSFATPAKPRASAWGFVFGRQTCGTHHLDDKRQALIHVPMKFFSLSPSKRQVASSRLAGATSKFAAMVFFSHPQAGGCRAADWGEATLTSGNGQSVRQNRMNEAGARRVGTHAFFVRFANLVRHSKSREGKDRLLYWLHRCT